MEGAPDVAEPAGTPPVGVVLAAGEGRRMGRPKALVRDADGTSWLNRAVDVVAAAGCDPVLVVLGAGSGQAVEVLAERGEEAGRVRRVEAPDWSEGMGASLRRGLRAALDTDATTAVVTLVDLPDVTTAVVERVVTAVGDDPNGLGRAAYRGVPGHPVVLGREHWSAVAAGAVGDRGARDYLAAHDTVLVECGDLATGIDQDVPPAVPNSTGRGDDQGVQRTVESAADLAERLGRTGYLVDDALATVGFLALALGRPLLLEGEPGTGKTALAEALAESLDIPLIRLQCYEGIDASQALYDWDFPRQILHLRAVEAGAGGSAQDVSELEKSLFDERFLLSRPVLRALREAPAVLLVDEIDRADDEFEAFLLEVLSTYQVTIPEIGTVRAAQPPIVILTSNRTRELHDALKRRCLYHWIDYPSAQKEFEIVLARVPAAPERLAREVVAFVHRLREADLTKVPGIAETLDWASALLSLGARELAPDLVDETLGVVLKYEEDIRQVRGDVARQYLAEAAARG